MTLTRPLYDNLADASYFVEPAVLPPLERALDHRLNVLLVGQRGTGKTTLLRQIQRKQRDLGRSAIFVDATFAEDVLETVAAVDMALSGSDVGPEPIDATAGGKSRALLRTLHRFGRAAPSLILMDASGAGPSIFTLFGRMRDQIWQHPHQWTVAIDERDRGTVLRPPADAFFDVVVTMPRWPIPDLVELLTKRATDLQRSSALGKAAVLARGNPREAVRALNDAVLHGVEGSDGLDRRSQLLRQAEEMGNVPGALMREVLERGHVNASDADLQRTLGVTRSRLNQVLRDLLDKGLVSASLARSGGPGRPRTIYRAALDRE